VKPFKAFKAAINCFSIRQFANQTPTAQLSNTEMAIVVELRVVAKLALGMHISPVPTA
jgi:hypothetical protein